MHIAICDDNVADRKQLERLLGRESDRRKDTTGLLYYDSYGDALSIKAHPMLYDVFFIDVCHTPGISSLSIVTELVKMGVTAPMVLCCSETDYRTQQFPEGVIFIDKPIKVADLQSSLDHAQEIKDSIDPSIELREEKETYYVKEDQILYATESGYYTVFKLAAPVVGEHGITSGETVRVYGNAYSIFSEIEEKHPCFVMAGLKAVLNCKHIKEIRMFGKAVMSDGKKFSIPGPPLKYAKEMLEKYKGDGT